MAAGASCVAFGAGFWGQWEEVHPGGPEVELEATRWMEAQSGEKAPEPINSGCNVGVDGNQRLGASGWPMNSCVLFQSGIPMVQGMILFSFTHPLGLAGCHQGSRDAFLMSAS